MERELIIEACNRMYIYTDAQDWESLAKVFTDEVDFDMTSLAGGEPSRMKKEDVCAAWKQGVTGMQAHHLTGNHLVTIRGDKADVFCYGTATHYLENATGRNSRAFHGTYDLKLDKVDGAWLISQFKYNSKFIDGYAELHTHLPSA
ncbi:hypothetical protein CTAYLR_009620 [Chrysophaeum taylorii]|uniref:SnoaL-like domain-containing protein n=1 Tax=Chrysophaeum taylorii TaxID=2483200 RepID=A0AAD7UID5_9STRA|nr:hypothetical protein CTAYLR_009620 [Chrysophaeum taylorii]